MKDQTTLYLPEDWKNKLNKIAHQQSLALDANVSFADLIRKAVSKEYGLVLPEKIKMGRPTKYKGEM